MTPPKMDLRAADFLAEQGNPSDGQYWQMMCDVTGLDMSDLVDSMVEAGILEPDEEDT